MTFEFLTVSVSSIFYFCNCNNSWVSYSQKSSNRKKKKKKKVRMFAFLSVGVSSIFHFCNLKQPKTLLVS